MKHFFIKVICMLYIINIVIFKFIKVEVVYQTVENLHAACPKTSGDWYFTGNYPTPGGFLVLRRALLNYLERKTDRSY